MYNIGEFGGDTYAPLYRALIRILQYYLTENLQKGLERCQVDAAKPYPEIERLWREEISVTKNTIAQCEEELSDNSSISED